jgi:hypothetical protein
MLILNNNFLDENICHNPDAPTSRPGHTELLWNRLIKLRVLYLHKNKLKGKFSRQLANLSQLRFLNLSDNDLDGVLPDNIGNMTSLRTLILNGNRIMGPVPLSIANLRLLRDFHIFANYPAQHTMVPRGFIRRTFERIYEHGPAMQVNSVHWDVKAIHGLDSSSPSTGAEGENDASSSNPASRVGSSQGDRHAHVGFASSVADHGSRPGTGTHHEQRPRSRSPNTGHK